MNNAICCVCGKPMEVVNGPIVHYKCEGKEQMPDEKWEKLHSEYRQLLYNYPESLGIHIIKFR